MNKKKYVYFPTVILLAVSMNAIAETSSNAMPLGRVQASSAAVNDSLLGIFGGDAMVPVFGDQEQFIFGDVMGDYATDATYLVSPGAGFRKVHNNQIFGAYFFGDYEQTSLSEQFWNLSPGVEWITPHWDAHVNGYFPTDTKKQSGSTDFASNLGNDSYVYFEENTHNQYDELVTPYAVIGNGVDAELAYSFDTLNHMRSRVYVGGYYYQPPSDTGVENIPGVTAGFDQSITENLKVSLFNSYDDVSNYHVGVSLTMVLGGESNIYSNDVHTRLLDPVQRHVGIIDTGAGTYDQQSLENVGTGLQYDNVYFTSTTGSNTADGTYGNPMALDQTSVDAIYADSPDSARIYVQGGSSATYTIDATTGSTESLNGTDTSGLYVHSGQSFYGRSSDYTSAATGSDKPEIVADGSSNYNGFIVSESGTNTFSDFNMSSSASGNNSGILVVNGTSGDETVTITNTNITDFRRGVSGINNSTHDVTINTYNSQFNGNTASGGGAVAYGMRIYNASTGNFNVNLYNSQFNNNSASGHNVDTAGLFATNVSTGDISIVSSNSQFNNNTATGTGSLSAYGMGLSNQSTGTITANIYNSQFNGNTLSSNSASLAAGLYANNVDGGDINLTIDNSLFNNNTASGTDVDAFGLYAINGGTGDLTININNSQFNNNTATGTDARAWGLYAYNVSTGSYMISATNSQFNNNTNYGFYARNESTGTMNVSDLSGSVFNDNGYYGIYGRSTYSGYMTMNTGGTSGSGNGLGLIGSNGNVTFLNN